MRQRLNSPAMRSISGSFIPTRVISWTPSRMPAGLFTRSSGSKGRRFMFAMILLSFRSRAAASPPPNSVMSIATWWLSVNPNCSACTLNPKS